MNAQPLVVFAGNNTVICPGASVTLGGTPTASGGTTPYTYLWTPNVNINNTTIANPSVNPAVPTWYYLKVTDATGTVKRDSIFVDLNPIWAYNAGNDTSICIGDTIMLGSVWNSMAGGVTYAWTPTSTLNNATFPRPSANPTITTTYSVTITSTTCSSKTSTVTVTVNPLPVVDACCATTINEGQTAILTGTGGVNYVWLGDNSISNSQGNPVTVEPLTTTLYVMYAQDGNGCISADTVTVTVHPDNQLYFYNTFSPNNDGVNDYLYIGNIGKYPNNRIEIFTRTGQEVFAMTGYANNPGWDGTNYGDKLPEATYYLVLDPGDGSAKYYKSITIVR